jgi:hypothetical protein
MGVHVRAVSAAEEALKSADILITGIDSVAPILETTHRREIAPTSFTEIGIMDVVIGLRAHER